MCPVMKASEFSEYKGVAFSFGDIEKEAQRILDAARQEARAILARAEEDARSLKSRAVKEGREEGYQKGHEEGAEEGHRQAFEQASMEFRNATRKLIEALQAMLRDVEEQRKRMIEKAKIDLVALAIAVAEAIVKREIVKDEKITVLNVRKAIELSSRKSDLVIRVHPDDLKAMKEFVPELQQTFASLTRVDIVADDRVMRGGTVVTNPEGVVDADIRTQLQEIERELLDAR